MSKPNRRNPAPVVVRDEDESEEVVDFLGLEEDFLSYFGRDDEAEDLEPFKALARRG